MSNRNFGEVKHTLSNVVGAVNNNTTKLNLLKIQITYLLKRIETMEETLGVEKTPVEESVTKRRGRRTKQTVTQTGLQTVKEVGDINIAT